MISHTPKRGNPIWAYKTLTRATPLLLSSALATACGFDMYGGSNAAVASLSEVENPALEQRCGADVVLVLDASSSIRNYNNPPDGNGAVDLVAGAADAFLEAFANTNSRIGVVSYNADPITQLGLTDVTTASIGEGGAHDVAIGDPGGETGPIPHTTGYSEHARVGSGTNWEAGLVTAGDALDAARNEVPRVVVHVTDGRPTRHLDEDGNVTDVGDGSDHLAEAVGAADDLKAQGVYVYSVGIGRAADSSSFTSYLQAVSGPDVFDQADPEDTFDPAHDDVILASDFSALASTLTGIAGGLCSSSLTITKLASTEDDPDTYLPAAGWDFAARPAATGGYDWVLPDSELTAEKIATTDASGRAQFQWDVSDESAWNDGTITITEVDLHGFELQPEVHCTRTGHTAANEPFTVSADTASASLTVQVGPGDAVACEVRNRAAVNDGCHPDTDPPAVTTADHELWPPNHKYYTVSLADCVTSAEDSCDGAIDVGDAGQIVAIYSDEPDNSTGDGNTTDDIEILDDTTFRVRAERRGMLDGRVYGVEFLVTDSSGNQTSATCQVSVPHDRSGTPAVDSGPDSGQVVHLP